MDDFIKQKIEEWYERYSDEIYRFILLMIKDQEKAKDLTHDTFLKPYRSIAYFQSETSDKNWLYKIARTVTIDEMRKKRPLHYLIDSFKSFHYETETPEKIFLLGDREKKLYESIYKLKKSYREVIFCRKIHELSTRETAEVLGWNESKVKVTLKRALEALRIQMEKEGLNNEFE